MKISSPESGGERYNSSSITTEMGTRVCTNSSEKTEMGQGKTKCADWSAADGLWAEWWKCSLEIWVYGLPESRQQPAFSTAPLTIYDHE